MATKLRCAIYTRKSSEEGLDQSFNSLHAQREACEAYVLSQAGEGWSALRDTYDDGGFSGGSMDRPGLARLLADIGAGKVDVVVVYKVDRLTRSLADFAKIVEAFDGRGVSFVSVTQAFNTTTSMGRLTLNVLLSFAQFEREVTGERIRDKIAASKAKGMWMGGMVPLGYDLQERKLVVNQAEAATVQEIYRRYMQMGSAKRVSASLAEEGLRSKAWSARTGKAMGGVVMGKGAIVHILQSRLYVGEIVHNGHAHPGQHAAIISPALFDAVAAKLSSNAARRRDRPIRAVSGPLIGLLFDAAGQPLSPSFAYGRKGRLYRYYIGMELQVGADPNGEEGMIRRISAPAVERFLVDTLARLSGRNDIEISDIKTSVRRVELRLAETHMVIALDGLFPGEHPDLALTTVQKRLHAGEQVVMERAGPPTLRVVLPQRLKLRGGRTVLVGGSEALVTKINVGLVNALKRAHADLTALRASPFTDPAELVMASAAGTQHDRHICRLAFMAPELQRRILGGTQPVDLGLRQVLKSPMPLAWADQKLWFETFARA